MLKKEKKRNGEDEEELEKENIYYNLYSVQRPRATLE